MFGIQGLLFIQDYITIAEEKQFIKTIEKQVWDNSLKRRVQQYGYRYDYQARNVTEDMYLGKLPKWLNELTTKILIRFDNVLSRMESLFFCNASVKVAAALLMCAKGFGEEFQGETVVKIPLTHKDIEALVGITRETTSLEMKKLERQGLLTKSGRFISIKDLKRPDFVRSP
mgnify:CR=1 FL=1